MTGASRWTTTSAKMPSVRSFCIARQASEAPPRVGRKAWLFADTPAGATASARLYSLIETAKANGLEPYAYLARVFADLPVAIAAQDDEAIENLLPWNVAAIDA